MVLMPPAGADVLCGPHLPAPSPLGLLALPCEQRPRKSSGLLMLDSIWAHRVVSVVATGPVKASSAKMPLAVVSSWFRLTVAHLAARALSPAAAVEDAVVAQLFQLDLLAAFVLSLLRVLALGLLRHLCYPSHPGVADSRVRRKLT